MWVHLYPQCGCLLVLKWYVFKYSHNVYLFLLLCIFNTLTYLKNCKGLDMIIDNLTGSVDYFSFRETQPLLKWDERKSPHGEL